MRVLAVGAHPDDVELGAGGTLARHKMDEDDVFILTLGTGRPEHAEELRKQAVASALILGARVALLAYPDQRFDSVNLLQLVQSVEEVIRRVRPALVYTHHGGDLNLDHRLTHQAVITACRPVNGCTVQRIELFEVPSSTEWGDDTFRPNSYVDISGACLEKKLTAFACYIDEKREPPHPRSAQSIQALARWRGSMAGVAEAEAFMLVRELR